MRYRLEFYWSLGLAGQVDCYAGLVQPVQVLDSAAQNA